MTKPIKADFMNDTIHLRQGDCIKYLRRIKDCTIDSIVTDPPYGLSREPDMAEVLRHWLAGDDYIHTGDGFMGNSWDSFVPGPSVWRECLRILKPGGQMTVFGGTRTYDLLVLAIRLAGFQIRDQLAWVYGTGFPKSHDVAQSIEKFQTIGSVARAPRDMGGKSHDRFEGTGEGSWLADTGGKIPLTTEDAIKWKGWGTALKPSFEPICLARKPLIGTVAANVLAHGTGGLNIDACRIKGAKPDTTRGAGGQNGSFRPIGAQGRILDDGQGRFPANLMHDGSPSVMSGFPGGSHRFFYSPKASKADRAGSRHPTVKPIELKRWLCRMITQPGGIILDPFAGSGTTGAAIAAEGNFFGILFERETQFCEDIVRRLSGPVEVEPEPEPEVIEVAADEQVEPPTDLLGYIRAQQNAA